MFTDAQVRYMEEVLGASMEYFHAPVAGAPAPQIVVQTSKLSSDERALLDKILGSVSLSEFNHHEGLTDAIEASHVVVFGGGEAFGREQIGMSVYWKLPALNQMLGTGVGVTESKKTAWALLQQFVREKNQ